MSYVNCPNCRSSNKAADSECYNCSHFLQVSASSPPPTSTQTPNSTPPSQRSHGVRKVDRSSNLIHGLRAGAAGGLAWGVFAAGLSTAWGGTLFAGATESSLSGFASTMVGVFTIHLIYNIAYGTTLGFLLGITQKLCYQADSSRMGFLYGGLIGLATGNILSFWWWEAPLGALAGGFISYLERAWFRKQAVEFRGH